MRVTKLSAGCPAPVAPLPPQVSPRSATFSMARSVTFSMAIDNFGRNGGKNGLNGGKSVPGLDHRWVAELGHYWRSAR